MKTTEIIANLQVAATAALGMDSFYLNAAAERMEELRQLCSDARDELVQLSCSEAGLDELIDKLTEARE